MNINKETSTRFLIQTLLFGLFLSGCTLFAANFDIHPIRIELSEKARNSQLTITNVSEDMLSVQVKAYEWNQNEKGEDVYKETQDVIVFPKILTMAKGEEKFIRLGTNVQFGIKEKTYRIYIEEIPSTGAQQEGASLRIFMKVGIPIFLLPSTPEEKAEIDSISFDEGKVHIKVKNSGNSHFIITGITIKGQNDSGQSPYNRDIGGWYLLTGSEKTYETDIPQDFCGTISNLTIEIKTSKNVVKKELRVDKSSCESHIATAIR